MMPTYEYSQIRYREDLDIYFKEVQQDEETKGNEQSKDSKKAANKGQGKGEEENLQKMKLQHRIYEIKQINENMRYLQNNIADRKTQNYKQLVEEKELVDYFMNQFELEEMQRNYNDYNLGDLLLVFPNPDKPDHAKAFSKPAFIRFTDAEFVFDNYLKVLSENGQTASQLVHERKAFLYSFLMLDQVEVKPAELAKAKKLKEEKEKLLRQKELEESEKLKKEKDSKTTKVNAKDLAASAAPEEQTPDQIQQQQQLEEMAIKKEKLEKSQWEIYSQEYNRLKEINTNENGQFMGFNLQDDKRLNKLLMDVPLEARLFKDVKKKLAGGKFLRRHQGDPLYQSDWICDNGPPRDFLTLVRMTIQAKLSKKANFHVRNFLSEDCESIYMILKGNEQDYDVEAEVQGLTKQLELGYADLLSLEPCDERYRPLRLKKQITSCVNEIINDKNFMNKEMQAPVENNKKKTLRNFRRIEDRTKMLYDVIRKWNTDLFWTNLALKQIKVNKFLNELSDRLGITRDFEKAEILDDDDDNTTRDEWEAYFVYLDYLMYFQKKMQKLHRIARFDIREKKLRGDIDLVQQNEAFLYKLIFRKALGDTNEVYHIINGSLSKKKVLMNIWDRLETRPISAYIDYFNTKSEKDSFIWRRYEVNEKKNRSKYLNMEKIKLTFSMVIKQINLDGLQKSQLYLTKFQAIHDPYQLRGVKKEPIFNPLVKHQIVEAEVITETEKEMREIFKELEDEAEGADFDAESVADETSFDIKRPWEMQIDSIRDYFGEKISLYFEFVQFFIFHLSYLGVIGIIIQIIKIFQTDVLAQFYLNTIFATFIIIWSTLFVEFWKRQQILFSIEFGQQDFEEDEAERPEFRGKYQRSIVNDKINEKYFSPAKRRLIMVFGMVGSFMIIIIIVVVMYQIFSYKQEWKKNPPSFIGSASPDVVTNIMNSVSILVFTTLGEMFANFLNRVENHKILSSYENSYISKLFLFQFFNTFNALLLIAFFNNISPFDTLGLCKSSESAENDCFNMLETQIITIFLTMMIKTFLEIITPFAVQNITKMLKKKFFKRGMIHPFALIDEEIEQQSFLNPYIMNDDLDGTVGDYLQLIIKFSFLTLFGIAFPPTFAIAFINNSTEMQMDRIKLLYLYQRPIPKGASNIGTWQTIIDSIGFIAIFANAGLIVYTSKYRETIEENQAVLEFIFMLISFLGIKYFIRFIVPDTPEKAAIINKRNQFAAERIIKGFKQNRATFFTAAKLNFEIDGAEKRLKKTWKF